MLTAFFPESLNAKKKNEAQRLKGVFFVVHSFYVDFFYLETSGKMASNTTDIEHT